MRLGKVSNWVISEDMDAVSWVRAKSICAEWSGGT